MTVPYVDLSRQNRALESELHAALDRVIASGRVLYGAELEAFEVELAAWFGVRHAVGVASGTDAVEIALRACIMTGSRMRVTALTAVPTINAMEAAGVIPVLADCDPVTRNWAPTRDDDAIAVHLYGLPVGECGLPIVEDIAHAMGARYNGRLVGTQGRAGAVSFYPTKTLGALGDGGAVITDDEAVAKRARMIRHYGFDNANVVMRGQNSRLSELQAAFLRAKLPHLHAWNDRRRAIAARYNAELAGRVTVPTEPPGCHAVYHVYVVEHPERDRLIAALTERGIGCMVHYPKAIHEYSRWRHLGEPGQFPVAEKLARTVLSLPCYPELEEREQDEVIAAVKELT